MKDALRDRWPEVRALFEAALAQPRAERATWLAAQPVDAALREAAAALLADADDETLGGIDSPGAANSPTASTSAATASCAPWAAAGWAWSTSPNS